MQILVIRELVHFTPARKRGGNMDLEFREEPSMSGDTPMKMLVFDFGKRLRFEIRDTHGALKSFYMDASSFAQLLDSGKDWLQSIQNQ